MKQFKESTGGGQKFDQAAKGGDLAKGLAMSEKAPVKDMIKQGTAGESTQRMPKGHDRI